MLIPYLGYMAVGLVFSFCVFVIGYLVGSQGSITPDTRTLENELGFLEAETNKAKTAVTALLEQAKLTRQNPEKQAPIGVGDVPKKPMVARLKQIKQDIKGITCEIESVTLAKDHQASETAERNGERDSANRKPKSIVSDQLNDPIAEKLFDFDVTDQAARSDTEGPKIKRTTDPLQDEEVNPSPRATESEAQTARDIVQLYNLAVTDSFAREKFREQVEPLRIGTVNAVERRQNPTLDAEFRQTTDGDLFAFPTSSHDLYAVVPRLGLTIETVSYSAGALGQVFGKTKGYDPKLFYSRYSVRRPAIFKCDGDRWELDSPGELELGSGD